MKTIFILLIVVLLTISTSAQKKISLKLLESLPQNLELKDELQKFEVTTKHFNGDIFGHFFNKQQVYGEYTRGHEDGRAKWNNVTLSVSNSTDRNAEFAINLSIAYMENFSYNLSDDMLKPETFESFGEHSAFTKNLVWDMFAVESFAWNYWNDLKLNEEYSAPEMNGKLDLAGQGSFENKDIRITWTGISKQNGMFNLFVF